MSNDLISRQAAIEALDGKIKIAGKENAENVIWYMRMVKDRLERLPSAQPERKKGRWVNINGSEKYQCSECGIMMWFAKSLDITPDTYIFCPHCGAAMTEEKEK